MRSSAANYASNSVKPEDQQHCLKMRRMGTRTWHTRQIFGRLFQACLHEVCKKRALTHIDRETAEDGISIAQ
jgi:hypothetical protein